MVFDHKVTNGLTSSLPSMLAHRRRVRRSLLRFPPLHGLSFILSCPVQCRFVCIITSLCADLFKISSRSGYQSLTALLLTLAHSHDSLSTEIIPLLALKQLSQPSLHVQFSVFNQTASSDASFPLISGP
jgi:hypothetical protein